MHSMYLAGVPLPSSMLRQPIHFAPGRHADLVARPVIADRGAGGVRAVEEIIARERRIVRPHRLPPPAWIESCQL